ncbi:hypothetical protein DA096_22795 [Vibrio rotiferianus]|jgi:hypothetical protein|uniref:hypothetical protein n=1 Tax=Vibrio rotiferianus TaxID=190895 RepID=UPI001110F8F8|nr:hypothetical protein [Vibrio rotiferianus]NOH68408.1 hypothetical protein [Vibrio rotiferianus]TMX31339.1 hypothetical protein DA095_25040 [Vibrio rotiferianus]TMX43060.1 hypothetical protein DA093_23305 [Vibrio rotiferianus]TMX56493.1 hypothetical protein DA097_23525 [Vibrio rotiferianus]TMX60024.1 hypothetical protein DA096_22795 [Vibrio rotiferianus]
MNTVYGSVMMWGIFIVWLTPFVLVIKSNKTSGREKLGWIVAMLFISWLSWVIYMFVAPIRQDASR